MIKSVTAMVRVDAEERYSALAALFAKLGFETEKPWQFHAAKGAPFAGGIGKVEFVSGFEGPEDVWIEVSDLESAHKVAKTSALAVSGIEQTEWGSRRFVVEKKIAFYEWEDPAANTVMAVTGDLDASGMRFGIVVSRWNQVITERLLHGALDALRRMGAEREDVTIVRVPGAFELPSGARALAQTGKVDAIVTLGCLIRGETTHYEHIAEEATRGIGQSAQETGIPHAYGLLTCETLEQALDRAGLKAGNKGFEAAMSAVEMVSVARKLKK